MANSEAPVGQRYDLVYLPRGEPTQDSIAFRNRLGAFVVQYLGERGDLITAALERELGVKVLHRSYGYGVRAFFEDAELRHILNAIPLVAREVFVADRYGAGPRLAKDWLSFVGRSLREENLGYRLDSAGGVHPLVDQHFEAQRVAIIAVLGGARYAAVLNAIENAHRAIEEVPPNGKMGIRHTFEAAEILFKLTCDTTKVQRLGADEIRDYLRPIVARHYANPPAVASAAGKMLTSASAWVDAAHPFRHGQKVETPLSVPFELAIAMMASGASFIRWLAEIDRKSAS